MFFFITITRDLSQQQTQTQTQLHTNAHTPALPFPTYIDINMSWWGSTDTADATEQAEERERQAAEAAEAAEREAAEAAKREAEEAAERQRKADERQRKVEETERVRKAAREKAMRASTLQEPDDRYTPGYASEKETTGWFENWGRWRVFSDYKRDIGQRSLNRSLKTKKKYKMVM